MSQYTDQDGWGILPQKKIEQKNMNDLRPIEEEELCYHNHDSVVTNDQFDQNIAAPYTSKQDYHENLIKNLEQLIQRAFQIILMKKDSKFLYEERKQGGTFQSKRRTRTHNYNFGSCTPQNQIEKQKALKDSFVQGGGTGSASGTLYQQSIAQHQNFHYQQNQLMNQSNNNIRYGSQMSTNQNQGLNNNTLFQPMSGNSNQGHLHNVSDMNLNQYYQMTENSRDEIIDIHNESSKLYLTRVNSNSKQIRNINAKSSMTPNNRIKGQKGKNTINTHLAEMQFSHDSQQNQSCTRSATPSHSHNLILLDQSANSSRLVHTQYTNQFEPQKWIPNEKSHICQLCDKVFGIFRRKHHCRGCGILVCNNCSPYKDYVPGYKDKKVRVCKECGDVIKKRKTETDKLRLFTSAKNNTQRRKIA